MAVGKKQTVDTPIKINSRDRGARARNVREPPGARYRDTGAVTAMSRSPVPTLHRPVSCGRILRRLRNELGIEARIRRIERVHVLG